MIDKALVERVQELKQTHGIGSKQAWDYLSTLRQYEALQKQVNEALSENGVDTHPSLEDIAEVSAYVWQVFGTAARKPTGRAKKFMSIFKELSGGFPQYHCIEETIMTVDDSIRRPIGFMEELQFGEAMLRFQDRLEQMYRSALKSYFSDLPYPETFDGRFARAIMCAKESVDVNEEIMNAQICVVESLGTMKGIRALYGPLYGSPRMSTDITQLSAYDRAVLENSLGRLDVERLIALQYLRATTERALPAEVRISCALNDLKKRIVGGRIKPNDDLRCSDIPEAADESAAFEEGALGIGDLKYHHKRVPTRKRSSEIIYKFLRYEFSPEECEDYIINRSAYTMRAIIEHEQWLKRMLA